MAPALRASLLVLLCACNFALREAKENADQALARGDTVSAVQHLRNACRLDPSDTALCQRAEALHRQVHAAAMQEAQQRMAENRPDAAIHALGPSRLLGESPDSDALLTQAVAQHVATCRAIGLDSAEHVVQRMRCFEVLRDAHSAVTDATIDSAHVEAATAVDAYAVQLVGREGAEYAFRSLAECLRPEVGRRARITALRGAVAASEAIPLFLEDGAQCQAAAASQQGRVVCRGGADALRVSVTEQAGEARDDVTDMEREVSYVAGIDLVENPEYRHAERQVEHSRARHEDARRDHRLAEDDCEAARKTHRRAASCQQCTEHDAAERACAREATLRQAEQEAERELHRARERFQREPPTIQRQRTAVYRYNERRHTWVQPWRVTVQLSGGAQLTKDIVATVDGGLERRGFEPAGITPSRAYSPGAGAFEAQATQTAMELLTQVLSAERERRASTPCQAASPDQEDCQVRRGWLRSDTPERAWLEEVSKRVEAQGRAWPPVACAR